MLCRKCAALFWKSLGHPCFILEEESRLPPNYQNSNKELLPISPKSFLTFFSVQSLLILQCAITIQTVLYYSFSVCKKKKKNLVNRFENFFGLSLKFFIFFSSIVFSSDIFIDRARALLLASQCLKRVGGGCMYFNLGSYFL